MCAAAPDHDLSLTTSIFSAVPSVAVYESPSLDAFETVIKPREQPAILKGLTDHWPAVRAGRQSPEALCSLLDSLAAPVPVRALAGAAATRGRFSNRIGVTGLGAGTNRDGNTTY